MLPLRLLFVFFVASFGVQAVAAPYTIPEAGVSIELPAGWKITRERQGSGPFQIRASFIDPSTNATLTVTSVNGGPVDDKSLAEFREGMLLQFDNESATAETITFAGKPAFRLRGRATQLGVTREQDLIGFIAGETGWAIVSAAPEGETKLAAETTALIKSASSMTPAPASTTAATVSSTRLLWGGTAYGMTEAQVRALHPSAEAPAKPARLSPTVIETLAIKDINVAGASFTVHFSFDRDRLVHVKLDTRVHPEFAAAKREYEDVVRLFSELYGEPALLRESTDQPSIVLSNGVVSERPSPKSNATEWIQNGTRIVVSVSAEEADRDATVRINFIGGPMEYRSPQTASGE